MCLINKAVRIYHYTQDIKVPKQPDSTGHYTYPTVRLLWGVGVLLQFAQDYEELRDGVGTYPVGIVMLLTGELKLVSIPMLEIIQD
jgi:hypothetical protein